VGIGHVNLYLFRQKLHLLAALKAIAYAQSETTVVAISEVA